MIKHTNCFKRKKGNRIDKNLKRIGVFLAIIIISGFVAGQEVFAFSEPPTKNDKQFMSILFLVGFVGIYTGIIYVRKSSQIKLKIYQS